jgi:DNA-binding GntR family transcriptional regulator
MQPAIPTSILMASSQRRIQSSSQSEVAYRAIKAKIISLELPPASLLNEEQLMAELKLGRTPIREALQRLALEALVIILPRRGTIVADLNLSDLKKIFELRVELEVFAAQLAAQRATPQQIAAMEALFTAAEATIREGNYQQLITLDREAHRLLAQATHNEFLEETLERLYSHVLRLWYASLHEVQHYLRDAIQEHRDLIAAIKAGDGERAREIMHRHVAGFQSAVMATLTSIAS